MKIVEHNPQAAGVPLGQFVAPKAPEYGLDQTLAAAFLQESDVVNAFQFIMRPQFPRDPAFDILSAMENDPYADRYADQLSRALSVDEYASIRARIADEERNKEILAASGTIGFIASAVAGVLSPTLLVPMMGPAKGVKGAAQAFGLAAAAVSVQEGMLYGLQETRTKEELALGITVGTVLGGLLGTAARHLSPAERELVEQRMAPSHSEATISLPREDGSIEHIELAIKTPDIEETPGFQTWMKESFDDLAAGRIPAGSVSSPIRAVSRADLFVHAQTLPDDILEQAARLPDIAVPVKSLTTTQPFLTKEGSMTPGPVTIARIDGELIIVDGNHRVAEAIARGETTISAKVYEDIRTVALPATPSQSIGAARVRPDADGIKRANTYVGRQVDRGADWLAAKGVPVVPKVIKTLNDPIGMLSKLSPITRQLENKFFPSARGWAARLQVPGVKLEGGMSGDGDAFSRSKVHYAEQAKFIVAWDEAWANYVTGGKGSPKIRAAVAARYKITGDAPTGKLTYTQFKEEAFRAANTGELHEVPEVMKGVQAMHNYFNYVDRVADQYHKERMDIEGVFPAEDGAGEFEGDFYAAAGESTGEPKGPRRLYKKIEFGEEDELQNYVHHIFDDVAIERNTVGFLDDLTKHNKLMMQDGFDTAYQRYAKRQDSLKALEKILTLDEAGITDLHTNLLKLRDDIDLKYGAVIKQTADLRKSMKAAGEDKDVIEKAVSDFESLLGPEYLMAVKQRRQISKELSVLNKVGAGLSEQQIKLLEQIDDLEDLQLKELSRVSDAGARLAEKLAKLSKKQARADETVQREIKAFQKAAALYRKYVDRADKLAKKDDLTRAAEAEGAADLTTSRMNKALEAVEKNRRIDFAELEKLQRDILQGVLVRTRDLNAKRVLREERIKARAEKADPAARAEYRKAELATVKKTMADYEDAFDTAWRQRGATGNPTRGTVDFTEQATKDAQTLYQSIMGNPMRVAGLEVLAAERGPQLQRSLNLPFAIKSKWLVRDPEAVIRAHGHSMFPDLEMYRMTGSVNGAPIFDELRLDYERKLSQLALIPEGPQREKASLELNKAYKDTEKDWAVLVDRFRHKRGIVSNSIGARMGRFAMNLNVTRFMGMVAISSLPDIARVTFRYGMLGAFNDAWKPLLTDMPRVKAVRAEANRFGIALDPLLHSRAAMINDTFDNQATRQNMLERGMEFLANKTGFVALFDRWTAEMKYLSTNAVFGEFSHALRVVNNRGEFPAAEVAKAEQMLADTSIGNEMASRIWAQYGKAGGSTEFKDGFRLPNSEVWDDFEALMALKAGVGRVVDDLIISPGLDRPSWMDENLAFKMVGQFRSFTYTSTTRILMAGLQEPDMVFLQGAVFSVALGALSYYTWAATVGGKAYAEAMEMDPDKWLYEAVGRSGILAVLSEGQRIGEQIPGLNDWMIFGANESRASRPSSILGAVLGPSYDLAEKLAGVAQGLHDPTQATLHQARLAMVPYQNVFYLRGLLTKLEEGLSSTLGIPERRN